MIKSLPSTEKEFDMKEVDKATPNWLKLIMLAFVAILMISFLFMDNANAQSMGYVPEIEKTTEQIKEELWNEMRGMNSSLHMMKEAQYDIILEDCDHNYFDFWFCSMSKMYAMNHVIRHFQSFGEDLYYEVRPEKEIAEDFEALNGMMDQWRRNYTDNLMTFNFKAILNEYENIYLPSKGRN